MMSGKKDIKKIIGFLKEEDPHTRLNSLRTLLEMLEEVNKTLSLRSYDESLVDESEFDKANETLDEIRSIAVEPLINSLKDEYGFVRLYTVEALGTLGDKRAVEPLINSLKDQSNNYIVKGNIAEALGKLGDKKAVEPLIMVLKDKSFTRAYHGEYGVCSRAAWALGKLGDKRAIAPLINALNSEKEVVKGQSTGALTGFVDALLAKGKTILKMLFGYEEKDKNKELRASAAEALGNIGDEKTIIPLINALKDKSVKVRYIIAQSLVKIVEQIGSSTLKKIVDGEAFEKLLCAFRDYNYYWETGYEDSIRNIAEILAVIGDKSVEPLISALEKSDDKHYFVDKYAAEALGKIGDERAVESLINVLKSPSNDSVKRKAAEALGKIGNKKAVEPLISALHEGWVKDGGHDSVVGALVKIGKSAVEPLIISLGNEKRRVADLSYGNEFLHENHMGRFWSMRALGEIGDERAVEPLIDEFKGVMWDIASIALERIGKGAVESLISALKDKSTHVRIHAAEVLGKIGDERAVESLRRLLDTEEDEFVCEAAAEALKEISNPTDHWDTINFLK